VIAQDIPPAETSQGFSGQALYVGSHGYVGQTAQGFSANFFKFAFCTGEVFLAGRTRVYHQGGALTGVFQGQSMAQAARSTRDQADFPFQSFFLVHGSLRKKVDI
jgi:hypothetical protein